MAEIEIRAIPDAERRRRVRALLPTPRDRVPLTKPTFERAAQLEELGFKPADAVHIAAAESAEADVLLSCDDRLCRRARRFGKKVGIRVANPLSWLRENADAPDA